MTNTQHPETPPLLSLTARQSIRKWAMQAEPDIPLRCVTLALLDSLDTADRRGMRMHRRAQEIEAPLLRTATRFSWNQGWDSGWRARRHDFDQLKTRLAAAERERDELKAQLETQLQLGNVVAGRANESEKRVAELNAILRSLLSPLVLIYTRANSIRRWHKDPNAKVEEWANEIVEKRDEAHKIIVEAAK